MKIVLLALGSLLALPSAAPAQANALLPIPDKLVVLTFDDGNLSDLQTVAPILKAHGFNATFFITVHWLNREKRLDWKGVKSLQDQGFEIGNHTTSHPNLLNLSDEDILKELTGFDEAAAKHGIQRATSFSYPGDHFDRRVLAALSKRGYEIARRGRDPEFPPSDTGENGRAYLPSDDHPFLIPSTMTRGKDHLQHEAIVEALAQAKDGKITVLTYHGIPDTHVHCSVPPERFRQDMQFLKDEGATVIAVRDLKRYVDFSKKPRDPFAPIKRRLGLRPKDLQSKIENDRPMLSWELQLNKWDWQQVAYRILVASTPEKLAKDQGDLWDSGKVESAQRKDISSPGRTLKRGAKFYWKVQLWGRRNPTQVSLFSKYQSKELLDELRKVAPGSFSPVQKGQAP